MTGCLVITGANGQVGSFLARRYHARGIALILLYHERTERISDLLVKDNVWGVSLDLCDYQAVEEAIERGIKELGQAPGALIHTASVRSSDALPLNESDPQQWQKVFDANLKGAYNILRVVTPHMVRASYGRIVLFGSDVTRTGLYRGSAYASSKAAIANLVRSTAQELAPSGVLINIVSPGPIDTVLEEDYSGSYLEFRRRYYADYLKASPGNRLVSKEEIADLVDRLISDESEDIIGQEIFFDGGSK